MVEAIVEQGIVDEADAPLLVAAVAAVVFAPCVKLLEASPGNCAAACGLTAAEASIPDDTDPVVVEPSTGAAGDDVDAFDDKALDEALPDVPALQPSAIERLPMKERPVAEQGVSGRLAAFVVVASKAEETVLDDVMAADIRLLGAVWFWEASCEAI